jgi:ABC-2 type transport system ATP-binding protein
MIDLDNVHKRYGSFEAVRGVSMSAKKGEVLGLLGPNGAGKTTLMKILTTYHLPSSGRATVGNLDVRDSAQSIRRIVGYLPERTPLYDDSTVLEYLGFVMDARRIPTDRRTERLEFAIDSCGLQGVARQSIATLSKGYRQRVGLAQAIIHDPEILILDEPTAGLDPNQILDIRTLVRELGKEKTVILSTHILQEVEAVCNRVVIIHHGRIAAVGTTAEIEGSLKGDIELSVVVTGEPSLGALRSTNGIGGVRETEHTDPGMKRLIVHATREVRAAEVVFDWAVSEGVKLLELHEKSRSLEQVFTQLTKQTTEAE